MSTGTTASTASTAPTASGAPTSARAAASPATAGTLLQIDDLHVHFQLMEGLVKAVDGASFTLRRGRVLAVVGESGCGKSITARSILQIVDRPGRIAGGQILYHRRRAGRDGTTREETVDLAKLHPRGREIRQIRGEEIAMIFQEPMTSFSPVHTIGNQIMEAILLHRSMTKAEARHHTIEMLRKVGMPQPERRVDEYPHQISGGMRQRAMIAMALSCSPQLLIADEPTTALDVTTQAQILELLAQLRDEMGMSIMLITHDLGVVAEMADDVAVMYLGRVVEQSDVESLFYDPKHPYTQALLRSIPRLGMKSAARLETIRGMVPDPYNRPSGCTFRTRCPHAMPGLCDTIVPPPVPVGPTSNGAQQRTARCLLYGGAEDVPGAAEAIARERDRMVPGGIGALPAGELDGHDGRARTAEVTNAG